MIGTTRARVSHFMNKFRELGYIDYRTCPHCCEGHEISIRETYVNGAVATRTIFRDLCIGQEMENLSSKPVGLLFQAASASNLALISL
jgi:hypothetical protein